MLVEKFVKTLSAKGRSKNTLELINFMVVRAEEWLDKPLETATFDEVFSYIEHVKENGLCLDKKGRGLSNGSVWAVEKRLIQFYTFAFNETDDIKFNKMVKKLKNILVDKPKNDIRPQDILLPEEVKRLINVATLERDRCLVASLYEAGLRLGELLALTVDMVEMDEAKQEVTFHVPDVEGCKTGGRSVLCVEIFGYVQDWLKCNVSTRFMPMSETGVRRVLTRLYDTAGINKPCYPHMLRHSSITNACVLQMQPNQISMRYWGMPDSKMLSTYLHLSEQIVNQGYRNAKGMGNGQGNIIINPLACRCVNCGKLIQSGELCPVCKETKRVSQENEMLKRQFQAMADAFGFEMRPDGSFKFDATLRVLPENNSIRKKGKGRLAMITSDELDCNP